MLSRKSPSGSLEPTGQKPGRSAISAHLAGRSNERVLRRHLTFDRIEDAGLPLTVMATDLLIGAEVRLTSGPAIYAVLASTALPGVFPPITIAGRTLVDGGIANNTPISVAIEAEATEVWVLTVGYSCGLSGPPTSAFAASLHSVGLLVQQRLLIETGNTDYPVPVHLVPPPCPIAVQPTDFSQSADLIEAARLGTTQWETQLLPLGRVEAGVEALHAADPAVGIGGLALHVGRNLFVRE